MSTVSISYDLAKDDEAQAFRIAVGAEDLFSALLEFYQLAVERRDAAVAPQASHEVRACFRGGLTRRNAAWALKANALRPEVWRRPRRVATLAVPVGLPYVALLSADAIFATVRAIDASFNDEDEPLSWDQMIATILAKVTEHGAAAAFQCEARGRGFDPFEGEAA